MDKEIFNYWISGEVKMDKKTLPSLDDYKKCLEGHDWYYEMSDDHDAWSDGAKSDHYIQSAARSSEEHNKLYKQYKQKYFKGA